MKKSAVVFVLLFCVMSLFGEDFFRLAQTGTPEQVAAAIKAGVKINDHDEEGRTVLMCAAQRNENPDVVTTLLKAGANDHGLAARVGDPVKAPEE